MKRTLLWVFVPLLVLLAVAPAFAQQLELSVESEEIHAGLPFVLQVMAKGFEETPEPKLSELRIAGCRITKLGVTPSVNQMVQIINGQRSEFRSVTFVYRFRVEPEKAGSYSIPEVTAEQGGKKAKSRQARFTVRSLDETQQMKLRLVLPERPLWIGETALGSLDWYLKQDPGNQNFVVPLFEMPDAVEIEAPKIEEGTPKAGFSVGAKVLQLPYKVDSAQLDGETFKRLRFSFKMTPIKAGTLEIAAPKVVAELPVGYARDIFGFRVAQNQLFSAVGKPGKLEVRQPPLSGRPESFSGAIGTGFSLDVQAPRTVVRLGDPIELRISVRGDGRLAGLALPDLHKAGLPQNFAAPEEPPSGELLPDGKAKLFKVAVRLRSSGAQQIPALSLGYFDPEKGVYQVAQSQPIALSVKGSAVVGAGDVIQEVQPKDPGIGVKEAVPAKGSAGTLAAPLVGADLALSEEGQTLQKARSLRSLVPLLMGLYGAPLLLLGFVLLRRHTRTDRELAGKIHQRMQHLLDVLSEAEGIPGRDAAPKVVSALRALEKELGLNSKGMPNASLFESLETEAYNPQSAHKPLSHELIQKVRDLARSLVARKDGRKPVGGTLALVVWLVASSVVSFRPALGQQAVNGGEKDPRLQAARAAYKEALARTDPDRRREGFVAAAQRFHELTDAYPDRPELLADFGTASLLAQEMGWAVYGYRRALVLQPGLERARQNLAFARAQLGDVLTATTTTDSLAALLGLKTALSVPQKHLLCAGSFALLVLLLCAVISIPRATLRRGLQLGLFVPGLGLLVGGASLLGKGTLDDAVVVTRDTLRSADSDGAPPALGRPLVPGCEVLLKEKRQDWVRVEVAGTGGWLRRARVAAIEAQRLAD